MTTDTPSRGTTSNRFICILILPENGQASSVSPCCMPVAIMRLSVLLGNEDPQIQARSPKVVSERNDPISSRCRNGSGMRTFRSAQGDNRMKRWYAGFLTLSVALAFSALMLERRSDVAAASTPADSWPMAGNVTRARVLDEA